MRWCDADCPVTLAALNIDSRRLRNRRRSPTAATAARSCAAGSLPAGRRRRPWPRQPPCAAATVASGAAPTQEQASAEHKTPSGHVADGCDWPEGPLADNAPKEAHLAHGIAKRILIQIHRHNTTPHAVARQQQIGIETLYRLINGKSWPNLITVARLEIHFKRSLWGNEHTDEHPQLKAPREYIAKGEWPEGDLDAGAPKEACLAQGIATEVLRHIRRCDTTPAAVASKRQISVVTLDDLISGHRWPDFFTVARLEMHFNRRLWGHAHKPRRRKPPAT